MPSLRISDEFLDRLVIDIEIGLQRLNEPSTPIWRTKTIDWMEENNCKVANVWTVRNYETMGWDIYFDFATAESAILFQLTWL